MTTINQVKQEVLQALNVGSTSELRQSRHRYLADGLNLKTLDGWLTIHASVIPSDNDPEWLKKFDQAMSETSHSVQIANDALKEINNLYDEIHRIAQDALKKYQPL